MDDYETVYTTICRVCLSQSSTEKMVPLIDKSDNKGLSSFGKAITIVTNVLLEKDDKLPSMMCQKCVYLLKCAVYFKLKCESTNHKLKRFINTDINNDISDHNIKEKVCEYVIFNQYFSLDASYDASSSCVEKKSVDKLCNVDQEKVPSSSSNQLAEDTNSSDKIYDFDSYTDDDDNIDRINDKQEYSKDINNILDTIQDIINTGTNVTTFKRQKMKRKKEKYFSKPQNNERNLICKICNKILANRLTYDHHMQRHNFCRFICDQCGKGFPVLAEMHMHQIARHGIGPYLQCDHCPYKAPRKLNLIEHLRIHTGERPFTCEKCGLTFRRRAIWRNHLVCHMEKTHQCTYCPRKFFRHSQMLAHCNNVHERLYMFMCSVCSVTYTKTETVRRHMVVKHGIPREKQGRISRVSNGNNEFPGKII
ncbi:unnamed protein product [Arctia plantaginis]|uniref:Uncharacterized protein n=1 Tax=Arctia plantaginis TaxID=874455 RepID=A0A8S0YZW0_ARCPL|nr:unnamed protein product [Arctia plantaginis]